MEDKVYSLLEKMYEDLIGKIDNEIQQIKDNMATKHDLVRLENKMDTKLVTKLYISH